MIKKVGLGLIILLLLSCENKERQVDVIWQNVIKSKNSLEEKDALEELWKIFPDERVAFAVSYRNENGKIEKLENKQSKDVVKEIQVKIWIIDDNIKIVKENKKPINPENYYLLFKNK